MVRPIRYILLILYSIWAYFWFFFLGAVTVLGYIVAMILWPRSPGDKFYWCNHAYEAVWSFLCGMKYRVEGKEHFKPDTAYVIASNHKATADLFIVARATRGIRFRPLSKIELTRLPIIGFLFKHAILAVDRTDNESRKASIKVMEKAITEDKLSVLIFPEGTRNRTPYPLKEFYNGAFIVAIETQTPLIPMVILNTDVITPLTSPLIHPGLMICKYLEPIETKGMTMDDMEELKSDVYFRMEQVVKEHRKQQHRAGFGLKVDAAE